MTEPTVGGRPIGNGLSLQLIVVEKWRLKPLSHIEHDCVLPSTKSLDNNVLLRVGPGLTRIRLTDEHNDQEHLVNNEVGEPGRWIVMK